MVFIYEEGAVQYLLIDSFVEFRVVNLPDCYVRLCAIKKGSSRGTGIGVRRGAR
jgi:hypothetical protein